MEVIFNDVSFVYNKGLSKEYKALNNINLKIKENKIYGITGKSGSGKTTLLELINGLIVPTSGEIIIGNRIIKHNMVYPKFLRYEIGFVNQFTDDNFLTDTVEKELEYSLKERNIQDGMQNLRALEMVGLNEYYLSKDPKTLSSGEKRLVSIASALVFSPKLLILDEPALGLDRINKKNVIRTLKRINKKYKVTIIIVSHDIDFLNLLMDNLIILENGKVLTQGTKEEILKKVTFLKKHDIEIPKILEFSNKVQEEKNIKLGIYDDVKDLIKAVYRNV